MASIKPKPIHTFLLVEDDLEIREIVAEMLIEEGFDVVTAANGEEGLQRLRHADAKMCLVLLDLMMPVMDGWQMRAAMLADPLLAEIPVVVVSGAADVQNSVGSLRASYVLAKPMKFNLLLDVVQKYCTHARTILENQVH